MTDVNQIVKRQGTTTAAVFSTDNSIPHFETRYQYVPLELRELKIWHPWRKVSKENSDRFRKAPVGRSGYLLDVWRDPSSQRTYADATAQGTDGVGIVTGGSLVCIDLDGCVLDATQRTLTAFAYHVYKQCKSYAEISPSGKGIKIFARVDNNVLPLLRSFKGEIRGNPVEIESLHSGTFATVTGRKLYASTPETINNISAGILHIMSQLPAKDVPAVPAPRPANSTELERNVIDNYNHRYTAENIVSRNGAKRYEGNLWHCPCPVHTGRDGSLYLRRSDKYGVVVKALNPACILHQSSTGRSSYLAAFDAMCFLECDGNMGRALLQAREELNQPLRSTVASVVKLTTPIPAPVVAVVENTSQTLHNIVLKISSDIHLTPSGRNLINLLMKSVDTKCCVQVNLDELAAALEVNRKTIIRATTLLIDRGYITKYTAPNQWGGYGANVYQLGVQVVTLDVTPYLNTTMLGIENNNEVTGQERGGRDESMHLSKDEFEATHAKPVRFRVATDHGDEQPVRRSPLPCPESVDFVSLRSWLYTLLSDKQYQLVYQSSGMVAKSSAKRLLSDVVATFGDVFTDEQFTQSLHNARQDANKAKSAAVFNEYRAHLKAMTLQQLKKATSQKKSLAKKNKGGPRETFYVAMSEIAQRELHSRSAKQAPLFADMPLTSAA